jgi:hypothetical protein
MKCHTALALHLDVWQITVHPAKWGTLIQINDAMVWHAVDGHEPESLYDHDRSS